MPENEIAAPEPAPKKTKPAPVKPALPAKIEMVAPFGFVAEDGSYHYWFQGMTVDTPDQIELIVSRGFTNFKVL